MIDRRVVLFRKQLESLIESFAATVRIVRWQGDERIPEPLQGNAAKLVERLGAIKRLASDKYAGPAHVVASLTAMSQAAQRLDLAYTQYSQSIDLSPAQREEAAIALDAEIDGVKAAIDLR